MSDNKKEQNSNPKKDKVDEELSDLLDSALEDFKKEPAKNATDVGKKDGKSDTAEPLEEEWNEELIKQAAAQFENSIASFLGEGDEAAGQAKLEQTFKQMADAAKQVFANPTAPTDVSNNFASSISQTIQGLNQGTENLNNPAFEQDLVNLFSGQGQGDQNAFLPFMQGMMQSLLSKDVLYPSLMDIIEKYPAWLESNKDKISAEDAERYGKQQDLMKEVCGVLDGEKESDAPEVKTERFEKVLALMQKLQDYGQPPTDLVGDVGPGLPDLSQAADPNQCSLM